MKAILLTGITTLAMSFTADASDRTKEFDAKHKACLEQIAVDADIAYEDAMVWRNDGGGRRARHCEAMALFALGHKEEAAYRLDQLGEMVGQISPAMRKNFYLEAANFWLLSNETRNAYDSATAGLDIDNEDVGLRIARARVYALLDRYQDAETDLSSALAFEPGNADALRYRADARKRLGKLTLAKADIDRALIASPNSVEDSVAVPYVTSVPDISQETGTLSAPEQSEQPE